MNKAFVPELAPSNCALYLDFDNVFTGLALHNKDAAEAFAQQPERWLAWLCSNSSSALQGDQSLQRKALLRRCYMNPEAFSRFRNNFTRAGFEVIDCPPLTTRGKTSTDMNLALDALEASFFNRHVNEFVLLSGDADFTALLLRLRKQNKTSMMVSIGAVSPAYKAAADYVVDQTAFISGALGIAPVETLKASDNQDSSTPIDVEVRKKRTYIKRSVEEAAAEVAAKERALVAQAEQKTEQPKQNMPQLLKSMSDRLKRHVTEKGSISAAHLATLYREFEAFRDSSNWLGFNSLRDLSTAIVGFSEKLELRGEGRQWQIVLKKEGIATKQDKPILVQDHPAADSGGTSGLMADTQKQYSEMSEMELVLATLSMPILRSSQYAWLLEELAYEINNNGYCSARTVTAVATMCAKVGIDVEEYELRQIVLVVERSGYKFGASQARAKTIGDILVAEVLYDASEMMELTSSELDEISQRIVGHITSPGWLRIRPLSGDEAKPLRYKIAWS